MSIKYYLLSSLVPSIYCVCVRVCVCGGGDTALIYTLQNTEI